MTVDVPFAAALCLSVTCSFFQLLERVGVSIARRDQVGNPFSHGMAEIDDAARLIGAWFFLSAKRVTDRPHRRREVGGLTLVRKWLFTKGKSLKEAG